MIINASYHDFDGENAKVQKLKGGNFALIIIMSGGIGGCSEIALHGMTPARIIALADKIREAAMPYIEATTPTP